MDQINHFEKIHLFDRSGTLSEPLEKTINGMRWRISFQMGMSFDGTTPAIDVRYSCEDFGEKKGCYVIMKCNNRRMGHFFQVNKSVVVFRQFFIGIQFVPREDVYVEKLQNRFKDWFFVEWKENEDLGFNLEPYYFYDPILFMSTTHLPMKKTGSVVCTYIPSSTFHTPEGEIPFEFDPDAFKSSNTEVGKMIENLDKKSEEELRELRDVLGYYYHDFNAGVKDENITAVQLQTHLYGFYTSVPPARIFSWEYRNLRVSEPASSIPEVSPNKRTVWYDQFTGVAKISRTTCLLMQRDFRINGSRGSIIFTMFKETVDDVNYVSFGAYFVMAPYAETYRCHIIITSSIPSMTKNVTRDIKCGQNTIAIPTLYKEESFPGQLFAFQFAVNLEKLENDDFPPLVVFPGISEVTLRFGSRRIRAPKKLISSRMDMFKVWFENDNFRSLERGVLNLPDEDFEGVFHVLDAMYHYSKQLTVESFKKFGCAADKYLCTDMFHLWEQYANNSLNPEIQKFISKLE